MLKPLVVWANLAVCQSQDEALESLHRIVHEDSLQGPLPLLFTRSHVLKIRVLARQGGDAKYEIQLCELVIALHLVRLCDPVLIRAQKGRLMKDWEERGPFLEVDVDASVREHARRNPCEAGGLLGHQRVAALDVKESLGIELRAWLAGLLKSALERLCARVSISSRGADIMYSMAKSVSVSPMKPRPLEGPM